MKQVAGWIDRLRNAIGVVYREAVKFGAVGAFAFVVDIYVFNVLRLGWFPLTDPPLAHKVVLCKIISTAVATVVAWAGNRWWTFRHRRQAAAAREFLLFVIMNVGGMAIAALCLAVSHYVFGLKSPLADNIAANGFGLVLGTLFRFWAYRTLVFTELKDTLGVPEESTESAVVTPLIDAVEGHGPHHAPLPPGHPARANGRVNAVNGLNGHDGHRHDLDRPVPPAEQPRPEPQL
jgi:putative flippase GtrA